MRHFKYLLCALIAVIVSVCAGACNKEDYGTLIINNIENLKINETQTIQAVFSKPEHQEPITYEFEGSSILIDGATGEVTGVAGPSAVTVTAKTSHHETTFRVTTAGELFDYGTLTIADLQAELGSNTSINPVFSVTQAKESIQYTFKGKDIAIKDGKITVLNVGKTVTVTAKTSHHNTTFKVTTRRPEKLTRIVYAWIDYPATELPRTYFKTTETPVWSGQDASIATFDENKRSIQAVAEGEFTLCAKAGSYTEEYTVIVHSVNKTGKHWELSNEQKADLNTVLVQDWTRNGHNGKTTLFIGDSFFDDRYFWTDFDLCYGGQDALIGGLSGSTSFDWEQIVPLYMQKMQPKNIVMHVGTNNFYDDHRPAAENIEGLKRMFTLMHAAFPQTKIYYFAISQRTDTRYIGEVKLTNEEMKEWCGEYDFITFLDTESLLTGDKLRDGIHPKLEYYNIFMDALDTSDIEIEYLL